jgi:hypothetical protein
MAEKNWGTSWKARWPHEGFFTVCVWHVVTTSRCGGWGAKWCWEIKSWIVRPFREVERILNQADTRDKDGSGFGLQLSCEQQGLVLCEVHLLRSYALRLSQRNCTREKFIEDLRELEDPRYNLEQRLRTIQRMARTWGFLTAPQRL